MGEGGLCGYRLVWVDGEGGGYVVIGLSGWMGVAVWL